MFAGSEEQDPAYVRRAGPALWTRLHHLVDLLQTGSAGQLQEHVLERRHLRAETVDAHLMFSDALDDLGDESIAAAVNRELRPVLPDVGDVT